MTDRTQFGHDTTADEVLDGIDLSGQTILITGGASGLGKETARALAAKGASIIIAVRKQAQGDAAVRDIMDGSGSTNITFDTVDLASLSSIRAFAESFVAKYETLDILINNAGVMACPFGKTEDGFEVQFGVNHLGHFMLTNLITPSLLKGGSGRVVCLSSRGHKIAPVDFADPNFKRREYNNWRSYGQSKTANALFAVGLDSRLAKKGVRAFSVHPGAIPTPLARHLTPEDIEALRSGGANPGNGGMTFKTVPAGAATSCFAATAPELNGKGGQYLEDCGIAEIEDDPAVPEGVRSYAVDPVLADRLWAMSETLLRQEFVH